MYTQFQARVNILYFYFLDTIETGEATLIITQDQMASAVASALQTQKPLQPRLGMPPGRFFLT